MHDVHVEDPDVDDILPAAQFVQVVDVVAPDSIENVPAIQLVQTDNPVVAAYVPLGHCGHGCTKFPRLAPNVPASQSLHMVGVRETFPLAQSIQLLADDNPGVVENFPAAQDTQDDADDCPVTVE